jgi:hypothetical protein
LRSYIDFIRILYENAMTIPGRRAERVALPFALLFVIYAVSPLTFTYRDHSRLNDVSLQRRTAISDPCMHIFFWDLICSGISQRESSDGRTGGFRMFFRKKRALVSAVLIRNLPDSKRAPDSLIMLLFLFGFRIVLTVAQSPKTSTTVHVLHSGLSPPPLNRTYIVHYESSSPDTH